MTNPDLEDATRWWWIRHAPVPQLRDQIYGSTDPDCDVSNGAAFKALAAVLPRPAVWIVSTLRRTRQTADAIGRTGYPIPELVAEYDLEEQDFGALHGVTHVAHAASRTDSFAGFWPLPPDEIAQGGESLGQVRTRVVTAVARIGREHRGRDIVCVSHGGPIRAILSEALGLDLRHAVALTIPNLSLTVLHELHNPLPGGPSWRSLCIGERMPQSIPG